MLSGIWLTQVGDPLCHGTECRSHCVSSDRVLGAAVAAVAESEDEEVGEASLVVRDITEGRVDAELFAEVARAREVLVVTELVVSRSAASRSVRTSSRVAGAAASKVAVADIAVRNEQGRGSR